MILSFKCFILSEKLRDLYIQGGNIEVKATQNYASYAFISKDYAKFRKETNFFVRFYVFLRFML